MVITENKEVKLIYYNSNRIKLGYLGSKLVFKDLEIADNLLDSKALDMRNWSINKTNYAQCFTDWSYNEEKTATSFRFKGISAWELIYFPIKVTPNTDYTWQWNFTKFNNLTSGDTTIRKLSCAILNTLPTTDYSASGNTIDYRGHAIQLIDVVFNADSINLNEEGLYTYISFNSGNNTTLYIGYNFGFVYDSQLWDVTIARLMLSEGSNPKIFQKPN